MTTNKIYNKLTEKTRCKINKFKRYYQEMIDKLKNNKTVLSIQEMNNYKQALKSLEDQKESK